MKHRYALAAIALVAASPAGAAEVYDCVIEPYLVVEVGSPVEGVIAEVLAKRGVEVKKGDVLARLESSVEEQTMRMAEANAASTVEIEIAQTRVNLLRKQSARVAKLTSKNLAAKSVGEAALSDLEQAELELKRARQNQEMSALDRDRAQAQLDRRVIRSPIDGIILRRLIGPGEYLHSQAQVAQLAKIDPLFVDVFLPTDLFNQIAVGQKVNVRPAEPIGGSYAAEIAVIDQVFDAASDTFGVRLELPNIGNKLPAGVDCKLDLNLS